MIQIHQIMQIHFYLSNHHLIQIVLNGIEGDLEVNGEIYNGIMPHYNFLTDDQIADLLTYVRTSFGNNSSEITMDEVEEVRKETTNSL